MWSMEIPLSLQFCEWLYQNNLKTAVWEDLWEVGYQFVECATIYEYKNQEEIVLQDYCKVEYEIALGTPELTNPLDI